MGRFSSGVLTGAGSTILPIASLYAGATGGGKLMEVGVFNTTAVAVALKLVRLTSTGTQGAVQINAKHDLNSGPPLMSFYTTHTVSPTLGADLGYRTQLGAIIGANTIWTFGREGLVIPVGVANGIGVIVENGTGQACQVYAKWIE